MSTESILVVLRLCYINRVQLRLQLRDETALQLRDETGEGGSEGVTVIHTATP